MELTLQRDHLRSHRRMIIGRSLAAAVASAVPLPVFDDRVVYLIQRGTLRKLAASYGVDLEDTAAQNLIYGKVDPPSWTKIVGTTLAYRLITQNRRKLLLTYMAARRAHSAGNYFLRSTLFNHYCAKLHVGLGLTGESALELRETIDRAIAGTPGALGWHIFRRGLLVAARATVRAPAELLDIATGGAVRKLLSRREPETVEAVEELDLALEHQLAAQKSFLARAATAVELQLSAEANPYLESLVSNFERLWRQRRDTPSPGGDSP